MSLKYITELSEYLKPVNHIIYEIVILISLYTLLNQNYIRPTKYTKSFVILVCIFAVMLDWFIWFDCTKTILFAGILCIYVYYNFTNMKNISNFMNILDDTASNYSNIIINPDDATLKAKEDEEIRKLTLIPSDIRNNITPPQPFDKKELSTNDYNDAYNFDRKTYKTLTDNQYAQNMLTKLHESPQYQAIQPQQLDIFKPQNINYTPLQNSNSDQQLLNSFQNPQRIFLDNTWLDKRTYNDNCISYKDTVEFGQKLEQCTNDHGNITDKQLDSISNNIIAPIYKSF